MTPEEFKKKIKKLEDIERKAVNAQHRVYRLRRDWDEIHSKLEQSPEWHKYCKEKGYEPSYNFGDILC